MDFEKSEQVEVLIGEERSVPFIGEAEKAEEEEMEKSKRCTCLSRCFDSCWIFNIVVLLVGIIGIGLLAAKVTGGLG